MSKAPRLLTGMLLLLAVAGISAPAVKAEPTGNQEQLISQLRGNEPSLLWYQQWQDEGYVIGRVRGKVGDIAMIQLMKPDMVNVQDRDVYHVNITVPYFVKSGDDVLVRVVDGEWKYIDQAYTAFNEKEAYVSHSHPYWITRLNLKEESEVQRSAINFGETQLIGLPPLQPSEPRAFEPEPVPQPIRGMW